MLTLFYHDWLIHFHVCSLDKLYTYNKQQRVIFSSIVLYSPVFTLIGNLDLENRQPTDVELNMMRKVEEENVR